MAKDRLIKIAPDAEVQDARTKKAVSMGPFFSAIGWLGVGTPHADGYIFHDNGRMLFVHASNVEALERKR